MADIYYCVCRAADAVLRRARCSLRAGAEMMISAPSTRPPSWRRATLRIDHLPTPITPGWRRAGQGRANAIFFATTTNRLRLRRSRPKLDALERDAGTGDVDGHDVNVAAYMPADEMMPRIALLIRPNAIMQLSTSRMISMLRSSDVYRSPEPRSS